MGRGSDLIYFAIDEIVRETEKAIRVRLRGEAFEVWLPKSRIEIREKLVGVPQWLWKKKTEEAEERETT